MLILEAIGIVGCAFAGAVDAVRARLDLFGAVMVAIVTALGGGTLRDVLLGVFPPVPLVTPWYFVVCAATALLVCAFRSKLARLRLPMEAADAVALALFTVTGATKAMQHGTPYYTAAVIGLVNGIGGGLVRDSILGRVPAVVRGEIYAIPAFGGALLLALSDLNPPPARGDGARHAGCHLRYADGGGAVRLAPAHHPDQGRPGGTGQVHPGGERRRTHRAPSRVPGQARGALPLGTTTTRCGHTGRGPDEALAGAPPCRSQPCSSQPCRSQPCRAQPPAIGPSRAGWVAAAAGPRSSRRRRRSRCRRAKRDSLGASERLDDVLVITSARRRPMGRSARRAAAGPGGPAGASRGR